jgi:hypothetical protein
MKQLPWVWFDHRTDLPKWLTARIGQITVEWSVLERELEEAVRLLADVDIRYGRILTTGMTARTRLKTATNLIQDHVYRDKLKTEFLARFDQISKRITQKLEGERNLLVHGLWDRVQGQWYVLQNSGSRPSPQLKPAINKLARAVLPQRKPVTANSLDELSQGIIEATNDVVKFCADVETTLNALQPPLLHKSPEYTRSRRRHRVHTGSRTPSLPQQ